MQHHHLAIKVKKLVGRNRIDVRLDGDFKTSTTINDSGDVDVNNNKNDNNNKIGKGPQKRKPRRQAVSHIVENYRMRNRTVRRMNMMAALTVVMGTGDTVGEPAEDVFIVVVDCGLL